MTYSEQRKALLNCLDAFRALEDFHAVRDLCVEIEKLDVKHWADPANRTANNPTGEPSHGSR